MPELTTEKELTPEAVSRYLRVKEMSQEKLAELTKVPQSNISKFINGKSTLSEEYIKQLREHILSDPVNIGSLIESSFIDGITAKVISDLLGNLSQSIEKVLGHIEIPATLFSGCTFSELQERVLQTEVYLENEISLNLQEWFEEFLQENQSGSRDRSTS